MGDGGCLRAAEDSHMFLPNDFLDCVCFLCTKNSTGSYDYGGTAFFISTPFTSEYCHLYLVTAKHCTKERNGLRRDLYARLNKTDGTAEHLLLPDKWVEPEDEEVDVVVMPFDDFDSPQFAYKYVPFASAATEEAIRFRRIGIGSEVFVSGLFTQHVGKKRNLPIVRAGIISSMMDEFEDENSGKPYQAYLTELQSIGGLSGSPVFARSGTAYNLFEDKQYPLSLLGVVRGHFDTPRRREMRGDEPVRFSDDEWDKIHNGIAIVTPVQEILKILESGELLKQRREKEKELRQNQGPSL